MQGFLRRHRGRRVYPGRRTARRVARGHQQARTAARTTPGRATARSHHTARSATAAGRTFYDQCRRILADLEEAERTASELHNEPRGELRVIAPTNFGLTEIGTAITDFLFAYPQLRINLTLNDRLTDPIEGGYDVAISVGMPRGASSSLIVRKLYTSQRVLCAAPDYLAQRGRPQRPEDLTRHDCLSYSYLEVPDEWHFAGSRRRARGESERADGHQSPPVLRTAAVRGLGIAYGPADFFRDDIEAGATHPGAGELSIAGSDDLRSLSGQQTALGESESLQRFHHPIFRRELPAAAQPGRRLPRRSCLAETPDKTPWLMTAIVDHERHALEQRHAGGRERRQFQRAE